MDKELEAQVQITRALSQLAVPIASDYADRQAIDARKSGNEVEAKKWDEGGAYRVSMYGALGMVTGGISGATGAITSQSLMPYFGEKVAELNLPLPVRTSLDFVIGGALGAAGGGVNGLGAALPQTALNYISHSPFQEVRVAVSKENARLENLCSSHCTEADFRRIDEQVRKVEVAMDLAHIAAHSELTSEQMKSFAQVVTEVMPGYGTAESVAQLITGKSTLTGEETSRFWAAVGIIPMGATAHSIGHASSEALTDLLKGLAKKESELAELPAPYSELSVVGSLEHQEVAGGHLLERHVGKTDLQLAARFATLTGDQVSTFANRASAEAAVTIVIERNAQKIADFMNSTKVMADFTATASSPLGKVLKRGDSVSQPSNNIRLILIKDSNSPQGYRIHTGYLFL